MKSWKNRSRVKHQVKQVKASYFSACGLTPRICESGSSVHKKPRISKFGNSFLLNTLYFPAIVVFQHCEQFRRYSQKLLSRDKSKLIFCMRHLIKTSVGDSKSRFSFVFQQVELI